MIKSNDVVCEVLSNAKSIYEDHEDYSYSKKVVDSEFSNESDTKKRKKQLQRVVEEDTHTIALSNLTMRERFVIELLDRNDRSREKTIVKMCNYLLEDLSILDKNSEIEVKGIMISLNGRSFDELKKEIEQYDNSVVYFLDKEIKELKRLNYLSSIIKESKRPEDGYTQLMFDVQ